MESIRVVCVDFIAEIISGDDSAKGGIFNVKIANREFQSSSSLSFV